MPSVVPYTPLETRRLLEKAGYFVVHETALNWLFIRDDLHAPFSVPRSVPLVPLQIANKVARLVGMSNYISWYQEEH